MALEIYDTLSREKKEFKPIKTNLVGFYQCGPTVYWTQHIGNMRAIVMADVINRSLNYLGYNVKFVRNYTDVGHLTSDGDEGEDKMEKGAKRENLTPDQIAEKYIKIYENDIQKLNTFPPTYKPKATKHIQEIIDMIQILLDKGFAYQTKSAIYFDVSKAKNYTRLSGQKIEEQISGAGTGDVSDSEKKHPQDFSLWFFKIGKHKNILQFWQSPWKKNCPSNGLGFPGWHIECSAMSKKYLGDTIDIHMGGIEHIPVHHTNEIAQSESANGVKFVNYWIHNGHLLVNNQKMSKSEGTSYSLSEIKNPLALRYFFLQTHYRSQQNFTWEALRSAENGLNHLYAQVSKLNSQSGKNSFWNFFVKDKIDKEFKNKFLEKIEDDFNTPQALAVVSDLLKSGLSDEKKIATILDFDKILGLKLNDKSKTKKTPADFPKEIQNLIEERKTARDNKNYQKSDEIRGKLLSLGYQIKDTNEGQKISKI